MVERTAESLAQTVQQYWLLIKVRHNELFEKCESQPPILLQNLLRDLRQYMKALHALCDAFPSDYPAMLEAVQVSIGLAGCLEWELQALESIWSRLPRVSPNPADARAFQIDGSEFRTWRGYWRSGAERLFEGMVDGFARSLLEDRFEVIDDAAIVHWKHHTFHFSPNQAKVVKLLVKEHPRPCTKAAILNQCEVSADRVRDVFHTNGKTHPAFNLFIVGSDKTGFSLAIPSKKIPKPQRKAR